MCKIHVMALAIAVLTIVAVMGSENTGGEQVDSSDRVSVLIEKARKLLQMESMGEGGEWLLMYLRELAKTGDPRIRPFFLEVMVSEKVSSISVARGLMSMGRSIIPALEKIKENDPYLSDTGVYANRTVAERAIEQIRKRVK